METLDIQETVGELVARRPVLSRIFEEYNIDFCCGGKRTLQEVCRENKWDPKVLVEKIESLISTIDEEDFVDASAMTLTELADHIEQTHHAYLKQELARLDAMAQKVAKVHGESDPRLIKVRDVFLAFFDELSAHMMKEEQILFPLIRRLEATRKVHASHCGSIANPIRQMEIEHHTAGDALARIRRLTDDLTPPSGACNTYRALFDRLAHLERDMHQHIHKEDHVLFPKALKLESQLSVKEFS